MPPRTPTATSDKARRTPSRKARKAERDRERWAARKTAVRRLSSMLPQSPAFAQALEADETAVEPPAEMEDGGQA